MSEENTSSHTLPRMGKGGQSATNCSQLKMKSVLYTLRERSPRGFRNEMNAMKFHGKTQALH